MTDKTASAGVNFDLLEGHAFMSLKTFRKSGVDVPTPVWFAREGDALYVITQAASGKVKRIRNSGRVEVTACDARGGLLGKPYVPAGARILPTGPETEAAHRRLQKKYGLQFRLFMLFARLRRNAEAAYLEITPAS